MTTAHDQEARAHDRYDLARLVWNETYRHDTLLTWQEVKPGTLHHRRVMAAVDRLFVRFDEREAIVREECAKVANKVDLFDGDYLKNSDPRVTIAAAIRGNARKRP